MLQKNISKRKTSKIDNVELKIRAKQNPNHYLLKQLSMNKILQILFLFSTTISIAQITTNKTYNYLTFDEDLVEIDIDTSKYKPKLLDNITTLLRCEETDESISISINNIEAKDTINNFEEARKTGEFIDLGKIDGYRTVILKERLIDKNKNYIVFLYLKIIDKKAVLFAAKVPEVDFILYEEKYKLYGKSMKIKVN